MRTYLLILLLFITTIGFSQNNQDVNNQTIYALRLQPGDDLKLKLNEFVKAKKIEAGYIISCVGSLRELNLRLANQKESTIWKNKFEIVSLVGTLSPDGNHLHLSAADSTGAVIGGHLSEGNIIYTTAELVIGDANKLKFQREIDATSTFKELKVIEK